MKISYKLKGTKLFNGNYEISAHGLKTGFKPSSDVFFIISPDGFYYETKIEKELELVRTMLMTVLCSYASVAKNAKIGEITRIDESTEIMPLFKGFASSFHRLQIGEIFDLAPIPEEVEELDDNGAFKGKLV